MGLSKSATSDRNKFFFNYTMYTTNIIKSSDKDKLARYFAPAAKKQNKCCHVLKTLHKYWQFCISLGLNKCSMVSALGGTASICANVDQQAWLMLWIASVTSLVLACTFSLTAEAIYVDLPIVQSCCHMWLCNEHLAQINSYVDRNAATVSLREHNLHKFPLPTLLTELERGRRK